MRTCYGYGFGLFCNMLYVVQVFKIMCKGITIIRCLVSSHGIAIRSCTSVVPRKRSKLNFTTNYFIIVLPVLSYSGFNCVIFSVTSTSTEFLKEYKVIINGFTQAFLCFTLLCALVIFLFSHRTFVLRSGILCARQDL